jgi:hypothetical protein
VAKALPDCFSSHLALFSTTEHWRDWLVRFFCVDLQSRTYFVRYGKETVRAN